MKKIQIKQNETGRSMVEMLGVLAIVGVLSIGGVAGYRYAVDKMNANEIINELKKRAITASQQRVLGQDINLAEYGVGAKIKGTYTVTPTDNYNGDTAFFVLTTNDIPQRVCNMILESKWKMPIITQVKETVANDDTTCPDELNKMSFVFHNTLDNTAVVGGNTGNNTPSNPNMDANGDCIAGYTGQNCEIADQTCSGRGEYWEDINACICESGYGGNNCEATCPNEKYPLEGIDSSFEPNGSCASCNSTAYLAPSACESCLTTHFLEDDFGLCTPCSDPYSYTATEEECAKCGNKRYTINYGGITICAKYCDDDELQDEWGGCNPCSADYGIGGVSEQECHDCNRFLDDEGTCWPCSMSGGPTSTTSQEECDQCSNRISTSDGECLLSCGGNQWTDYLGDCHLCSDPEAASRPATEKECLDCGNHFITNGGSCYSCSFPNGLGISKEECSRCDETDNPRIWDGRYCRSCSASSSSISATKEECLKCSATRYWNTTTKTCDIKQPCTSTEFSDQNGVCQPCSSEVIYANVSKKECDRCGNRTMTSDGYCAPLCTGETWMNSVGACLACSEPSSYPTTKAECDKCGDRFMATDGICYSCSTNNSLNATETECGKCAGKRYLRSDGRCAKYCEASEIELSTGTCTSCNALGLGQAGPMIATECTKCSGRFWSNNMCYSCTYSDAEDTTETECDRCNNRFFGSDGKCYACFEPKPIQTTEEECSKCQSPTKRTYADGYCSR